MLSRQITLEFRLSLWVFAALSLFLVTAVGIIGCLLIPPAMPLQAQQALGFYPSTFAVPTSTITVTATTQQQALTAARCIVDDDDDADKPKPKLKPSQKTVKQLNQDAVIVEACQLLARIGTLLQQPWGQVGLEEFLLRDSKGADQSQPPALSATSTAGIEEAEDGDPNSSEPPKDKSSSEKVSEVLCESCLREEGTSGSNFQPGRALMERVGLLWGDSNSRTIYTREFLSRKDGYGEEEDVVVKRDNSPVKWSRRHAQNICEEVWNGGDNN